MIGLVERMGVFMVFILMRSIKFEDNRWKKQMANAVYDWLTQLINVEYLMDWFKGKFLTENETKNSVFSAYSILLDKYSHDYYDALMKAELDFGYEVMRPMMRKENDERIPKMTDDKN